MMVKLVIPDGHIKYNAAVGQLFEKIFEYLEDVFAIHITPVTHIAAKNHKSRFGLLVRSAGQKIRFCRCRQRYRPCKEHQDQYKNNFFISCPAVIKEDLMVLYLFYYSFIVQNGLSS